VTAGAGLGTGGPRVVAVGGGHGLAASLRACATYAAELTAIVSVADDGGSSGRLRAETGLPAMGDIRRCLTELAAPDQHDVAAALELRFDGHTAGNLLLAGLADAHGFLGAVRRLGELLGVGAAVLPATTEPVELVAETVLGETVRGQVAVQTAKGVVTVALDPPKPDPPAAVLAAIAAADQVVLGPGSLFTSVLAALAVPAVADAVVASTARCVFVCNLRPQEPETAGYDVAAHLGALRRHGVVPDVVVAHPGAMATGAVGEVRVERADVARRHGLAHDPAKLGAVLAGLL
jgi:uncharacterized cofD-like protein